MAVSGVVGSAVRETYETIDRSMSGRREFNWVHLNRIPLSVVFPLKKIYSNLGRILKHENLTARRVRSRFHRLNNTQYILQSTSRLQHFAATLKRTFVSQKLLSQIVRNTHQFELILTSVVSAFSAAYTLGIDTFLVEIDLDIWDDMEVEGWSEIRLSVRIPERMEDKLFQLWELMDTLIYERIPGNALVTEVETV